MQIKLILAIQSTKKGKDRRKKYTTDRLRVDMKKNSSNKLKINIISKDIKSNFTLPLKYVLYLDVFSATLEF